MFEIGNSLREARLRRHIDLVVAEDDTKIRSKYLAAMETEDFDVLPGPVYTRGFLRTYSRYLGLEAQLYIDEYNSRFGRFEDAEEAVARRPDLLPLHQRRGVLNLRNVAIASLLVIAGLAWLGLRAGNQGDGRRDVSGSLAGASDRGSFPARHVNEPSTPAADAAERRSGKARARAAAARRLRVTARGGSTWVEVRAGTASGKVAWSGTLAEGEFRTFPAKRLHVTIGYPAAARLQVGGRRLAPTSATTTSYVVTPTAITPVA